MKKRSVTPAEAVARIAAEGARVMIGGFMGVGSPHRLIAQFGVGNPRIADATQQVASDLPRNQFFVKDESRLVRHCLASSLRGRRPGGQIMANNDDGK